jgi:hypothetical protein
MTVTGRLVSTDTLSDADREQMLALMLRHYANVQREVFLADLREKQWVIEVRESNTSRLCGFSTQMVLDVPVNDRRVKALFSGDTIIDKDYWGDPALMRVTVELALSLVDRWPTEELYWFLISQGYKTYRFLPLMFHEFFPRFDKPTPDWELEVLNAVGKCKYPQRFDPTTGVIRSTDKQYFLRDGVADVTDGRRRDPHVRFFLERNPGFVHGDELCCIAQISRGNLAEAAYRVIGQRHPRDAERAANATGPRITPNRSIT